MAKERHRDPPRQLTSEPRLSGFPVMADTDYLALTGLPVRERTGSRNDSYRSIDGRFGPGRECPISVTVGPMPPLAWVVDHPHCSEGCCE